MKSPKPLFHPKINRSGMVETRKKYFRLWHWWIGVGATWLDCGRGFKCPVAARSSGIFQIDVWYFTFSVCNTYRLYGKRTANATKK